jgi:hypothetical protein
MEINAMPYNATVPRNKNKTVGIRFDPRARAGISVLKPEVNRYAK